jgi:hypothetical protein
MSRIRNRMNKPRRLTVTEITKESSAPREAAVAHQLTRLYHGFN